MAREPNVEILRSKMMDSTVLLERERSFVASANTMNALVQVFSLHCGRLLGAMCQAESRESRATKARRESPEPRWTGGQTGEKMMSCVILVDYNVVSALNVGHSVTVSLTMKEFW